MYCRSKFDCFCGDSPCTIFLCVISISENFKDLLLVRCISRIVFAHLVLYKDPWSDFSFRKLYEWLLLHHKGFSSNKHVSQCEYECVSCDILQPSNVQSWCSSLWSWQNDFSSCWSMWIICSLILLLPITKPDVYPFQLLERALNECGDDIETAIKSLTELRLSTVENFTSVVNSVTGNESNQQFRTQGASSNLLSLFLFPFCLKFIFAIYMIKKFLLSILTKPTFLYFKLLLYDVLAWII